jgi:hypothetical protein
VKLSFRNATRDDWEAIQQLHRDQQAAQETDYELPWLFSHPIKGVIVGCDAAGVIRQCFYGEAVIEMRFVGCDPRMTAQSQRQARGFAFIFMQQGYRWMECFVPRPLMRMIGKPLRRAGFECVDEELAHFTMDMRKP